MDGIEKAGVESHLLQVYIYKESALEGMAG